MKGNAEGTPIDERPIDASLGLDKVITSTITDSIQR